MLINNNHDDNDMRERERERESRGIPEPCQRTEKVTDHDGDTNTSYNWSPQNSPEKPGKEIGRIGDLRKNSNDSDLN